MAFGFRKKKLDSFFLGSIELNYKCLESTNFCYSIIFGKSACFSYLESGYVIYFFSFWRRTSRCA